MPLCPRCTLLALALALLAFAGCDTNNPGSSLVEVQGVYSVEELTFDPTDPGALADVDVLADLRVGTRVEVVGDGTALVRFQPLGSGASQIVFGSARATSRTVTFRVQTNEDADKLRRVLLPPSFTLNRDETDPNRLSADLLLDDVDLEAYDPAAYTGLDRVRGRMTVTLDRIPG